MPRLVTPRQLISKFEMYDKEEKLLKKMRHAPHSNRYTQDVKYRKSNIN